MLDTLKGLEAARKHMYKQNTSSSRSPWLGYNCIIIKEMGIEHNKVPSVYQNSSYIQHMYIIYNEHLTATITCKNILEGRFNICGIQSRCLNEGESISLSKSFGFICWNSPQMP